MLYDLAQANYVKSYALFVAKSSLSSGKKMRRSQKFSENVKLATKQEMKALPSEEQKT